MDNKQLLFIQTISDVRALHEEQEAGFYKNNPKAFNRAWAKIAEKVEKLEAVETLEEKAEVEDREAEEVGSEEYPLGGMVEPYDIEREKN